MVNFHYLAEVVLISALVLSNNTHMGDPWYPKPT